MIIHNRRCLKMSCRALFDTSKAGPQTAPTWEGMPIWESLNSLTCLYSPTSCRHDEKCEAGAVRIEAQHR